MKENTVVRKIHEDVLGVAGAETVIGTGVSVTGDLTSESDISVDGLLVGSITTSGDVTIGVNANVKGNIAGTNVTIAGTLKGNISATGEARIRETGNLHGDIKSTGLAVSSGGIFIGRSLMTAPPSLKPPEQPTDAAIEAAED
jgi:cytoskeletal protein CcmA (bactofilin family)